MVKILSIILSALSGVGTILDFLKSIFVQSPQEKIKEIIKKSEDALDKAKKTGDTSDLEKLLNR